MNILAIDTSSKLCSVAVLNDKNLIDKIECDNGLTHSETLMPLIQNLLDKYGSDFSIGRVPCLIKFTEGKITAVEDGLNGALLTRDEALNFLDINDKAGQ